MITTSHMFYMLGFVSIIFGLWSWMTISRLEWKITVAKEALWMIVANTEPDAIKHCDYDHLAKDICDCANAALSEIRS
jgi:hypothetical protein